MNTTTPSRTIKHAFVTGATGLLGNNLVRALLKKNISLNKAIWQSAHSLCSRRYSQS